VDTEESSQQNGGRSGLAPDSLNIIGVEPDTLKLASVWIG
jgi:hypothetical protein